MKSKTLVFATLVFAALLALLVVTRMHEPKAGQSDLQLPKLNKDDVTRVEVTLPLKAMRAPEGDPTKSLTIDHKQVVLLKEGTTWFVADGTALDKKLPAEEAQVKLMLDAIGELQPGERVADKHEKLADYEIDTGKGLRAVITSNGPDLDLYFGRATRGGGVTVRETNSDDVYAAKGRLPQLLRRDVSQWRKHLIVDAKPEDFTQLAISLDDGTHYTLDAHSEAPTVTPPKDGAPASVAPQVSWQLNGVTLPAGFRLDDSSVGRAAQTLAGLRAQDFSEAGDDVTGFGGSHTVVTATKSDGSKVVLHIGKIDDKKRAYVKLDGDTQVYLVSQFTTDVLARKLDAFRDLSLLAAKYDDVERITFKSGSDSYVVERQGTSWALKSPKAAPDFDPSQVGVQVNGVLRLKGSHVWPQLKEADAKLDDKNGPTIELGLKGGKVERIRFGAGVPLTPDEEKVGTREPREFYVKGSADGLVYSINSFARARYAKPADLFKKPAPSAMAPGRGGGPSGLDKLPPDVRKKIEEAMKHNDLQQQNP